MGTALVGALGAAGVDVRGPAGRDATGEGADIVLLAVPDAAIATAAARIAPGRLVGHLSGATTLEPLASDEAGVRVANDADLPSVVQRITDLLTGRGVAQSLR